MSDKRLIDANALMKNIGKIPKLRGITYGRMKKAVEETLTIDAVEVVRCKECKYRGYDDCPMCHDWVTRDMTVDDGFCHKGAKMYGRCGMLIQIAGITEDSIVDGPGLRLTVFVQGCHHGCKGCHNPETHRFDGGQIMNTAEIIAKMDSNPLLDGITLSGGEPFLQQEACTELAKAAHERGLNVWCYTGYTWEVIDEALEYGGLPFLDHIDVLVDGPYIENQRTLELPWRGSRNQRLIDVQESLRQGKAVEYGGANDVE